VMEPAPILIRARLHKPIGVSAMASVSAQGGRHSGSPSSS
jgi:hypothetical protein